jgi:hypothetical protein
MFRLHLNALNFVLVSVAFSHIQNIHFNNPKNKCKIHTSYHNKNMSFRMFSRDIYRYSWILRKQQTGASLDSTIRISLIFSQSLHLYSKIFLTQKSYNRDLMGCVCETFSKTTGQTLSILNIDNQLKY